MLVEGTLGCEEETTGREGIVEGGGTRVETRGGTGADSELAGLVSGLLIEIGDGAGLIEKLGQRPVERG